MGMGREGIRQSKPKINRADNDDSDNAAFQTMIICSIIMMMMRMAKKEKDAKKVQKKNCQVEVAALEADEEVKQLQPLPLHLNFATALKQRCVWAVGATCERARERNREETKTDKLRTKTRRKLGNGNDATPH